MKPIITSLIFHLAFILYHSPATAGTILQEHGYGAGVFHAPWLKGQTFLAEDPFLASVSVRLDYFNPWSPNTPTVNFSLFSGSGIAGEVMAQRSGTRIVPGGFVSGGWMNFDLTGVSVIPGETYTFIIQSPTPYWGAYYNFDSEFDYPGGQMLTDRGFSPNFDMTFRVTPIPEPATMLLFLVGCGAVVWQRIKSKG